MFTNVIKNIHLGTDDYERFKQLFEFKKRWALKLEIKTTVFE